MRAPGTEWVGGADTLEVRLEGCHRPGAGVASAVAGGGKGGGGRGG
jgi:hypothetical protein